MENKRIKLLDCTLRDGGLGLEDASNYQTDVPIFEQNTQEQVIRGLTLADIDLIEVGSIEITDDNKNGFSIYKSIEDISRLLPENDSGERYAALFRGPDTPLDEIPMYRNGLIKNIRVIIRYSELQKSIDFCRHLSEKGYNVFIQPMVTIRYTDDEIDYMIKAANEMHAYALYIVDSYGSMYQTDVERLYNVYNAKLDTSIYIGFHAHNNLNLAFSNVLYFINASSDRNIIADSTCLGMGQGAGNMQTELLADYLIKKNWHQYDYAKILDVCEIIEKYTTNGLWGYNIMYLIPAISQTAYKFSVALSKKYNLSYGEIYNILKEMPDELRHRYSAENMQKLLDYSGYSIRSRV